MVQIIDHHHQIFTGTLAAFLNQKEVPFFPVPLMQAQNILHLPFTGGHHPFTEGIKAYHLNPDIEVEDSPMGQFYQHFQPKNLLEAFFGDENHPLIRSLPQSETDILKTMSSKWYVVPWVKEPIEMGGFGEAMPKEEGSHYLGPTSKRHLHSEWNRLKSIYHSVKDGFDLNKQSDTIRGYFLTHPQKTVAVMVGGNHRTGVLSALNAPYIPMELHPDRPALVRLDEIDSWPLVKSQQFSPALAQAVFLSFFT